MKSGNGFHRPSQRGFTLFELMVSLAVTVVLVLAILALFDFSGRLARVQTNVAEMQQSVRVSMQDTVRLVRMAGRGGLPLGPVPNGLAVEVRNNLPAGATIGGGATPAVVAGSDVLLVRGVFSAPIYQINAADPASFTLAGGAVPNRGTLRVAASTPTGIAQDVEPLRRAVRERIPEALVLVSPRDAALYAVVELDPATSDLSNPDLITVGFRISGGRHTADYARLSRGGGFPLDLTSVAFVGLLEEHRYYLRERFVGADLEPAALPGARLPRHQQPLAHRRRRGRRRQRRPSELGPRPRRQHPRPAGRPRFRHAARRRRDGRRRERRRRRRPDLRGRRRPRRRLAVQRRRALQPRGMDRRAALLRAAQPARAHDRAAIPSTRRRSSPGWRTTTSA